MLREGTEYSAVELSQTTAQKDNRIFYLDQDEAYLDIKQGMHLCFRSISQKRDVHESLAFDLHSVLALQIQLQCKTASKILSHR